MEMIIISVLCLLNILHIFWLFKKNADIETKINYISSNLVTIQNLRSDCITAFTKIDEKLTDYLPRTAKGIPSKKAKQGNRRKRSPEERQRASENAKARWALKRQLRQQLTEAKTALSKRGNAP